MCSNEDPGFIIPTSEQNYKILVDMASGISSVKFSGLNQAESFSSRERVSSKADKQVEKTASGEEEVKAEIQEPVKEEKKEAAPEKRQEQAEPAGGDQKTEDKVEESKKESTPEAKENMCKAQEAVAWFPFKPFADTARAVGIPALSSYKTASESFASFDGILDSTALLGLYYFDYDRLVIDRPSLGGKEGAWISKSLLSLIYKSEQDDPLSFLVLGYGITPTHWEGFVPDEELEAQEIVLEEQAMKYDSNYRDIS